VNLTLARKKFRKARGDSTRIRVYWHAWKDHPDRMFTPDEIMYLVSHGAGRLLDNHAPTAIDGSFIFRCQDRLNRRCEIVVLFEPDTVSGEWLLVISAYRKV
jgi:hypothetical protein